MQKQAEKANWQNQLKQALSNQHDKPLNSFSDFSADAANLFPTVITAEMLQMANELKDSNNPVLAQFLPTQIENIESKGYQDDPVGDHQATQVPGLIHKYHGRVLLIASGSCAVNCRYCFRRHFPYIQSFAPRNHWQASLDYIENDSSIHEVILSGGDPLTLETQNLKLLTNALQQMPHLKTLRIHSRIPVVMPERIDAEFIQWSQRLKLNKVMVLHVNHAMELGNNARQSIADLKAAGYILLNQSVLLKDINDNAEILAELSTELFKAGVIPYYLHQMDKVQNAAHFTVKEHRAIKIHQQLQKILPGYLVPKLVKELAGQSSKTNIYN